MSAVVGIFYLDRREVELDAIQKMVENLSHRGSDAIGIWSQDSIGLGQRLLWTTPESRLEKLPMTTRDGWLSLTCDARIDNRQELISQLDFSGRKINTITDSEIILKAYQKWGQSCPAHLVGDFVFAVWDAHSQTLFCARDHMGVKPFYYFHSRKLFAFASEIKALFCIPEIPRILNEVHLGEQLALFPGEGSTYYREIHRLPGGYSLHISPDRFKRWMHWRFNSIQKVNFKDNRQYYEAFLDVFTEAVRCRLRSDFPVGSTLSGGLDSSSIACRARDLYQQTGDTLLHTFSAIFPGLPEEDLRIIDERQYMNAVVDQGGFIPHWIEADRLSPLTGVKSLLWGDDEPIGAPNLYLHAAMYQAAQDQGVRIFLDGIDGDTAISHGYQYLTELIREGRWITLYREIKAITQDFPNSSAAMYRVFRKYCLRPLVPEPLIRSWLFLRGKKTPSMIQSNSINPDFARRIDLQAHVKSPLVSAWHGAMKLHWLFIINSLNHHILEIADKASARYSLEGRYPFFDRRLLEFMIGLPSRFKLHNGWTRFILRQSMEGILPREVQWRKIKSDLSPNFRRRLLDIGLEELEHWINDSNIFLQPYMDINALRQMYNAYRTCPNQSSHESLIAFRAYILSNWLQNSW